MTQGVNEAQAPAVSYCQAKCSQVALIQKKIRGSSHVLASRKWRQLRHASQAASNGNKHADKSYEGAELSACRTYLPVYAGRAFRHYTHHHASGG